MKKNITKIITRFTITLLISIVLLSGTFNQQTFANENNPKLEFWFEVDGKQVLSYEDFMGGITTDYNYQWTEEIDLILVDFKVKSLTGTPERLSAIDFDIEYNDHILHIDSVTSSTLVLTNPLSPKRWSVPNIHDDNNKVYFTWVGASTLDPLNEYVPTDGILIGTIGLKLDVANIPNDFLIEPVINLNGNYQDIGDLAYIDDNGVQQKYYNEDFVFKPLQVGEPNAGPDASLSSLKVESESTTYLNLTNDIEEDPFIHEVTVSYADNKIENGITITASPKKAGADVQINGTKSFYTTGDIITIEVTDSPETKTYKIKITVTDPNDDTSVTFTTNKPSSVKSQGFNGTNSYDITVDFNTLEIQVIPNVHELSTVDVTPLNFTNLQPGETKSLTVWVTSEAGTNNAYTVNVTRELGNSDTSFKVVINSQSVTKEDDTYYKTLAELEDRFSFTISDFVSTTKIYYKLGKHTGVDIADYTILPANRTLSNIPVQKNNNVIYTLLAVPQDGTPELSYIEVERDPSTDVNLSKVTISEIAEGTTHTQDLTRINNTYTYTVKDNDSNIIMFLVSGITGEGQLIEILDENNIPVTEVATSNLNVGDNNYIIRVTAQDGSTVREYNLVVKKLSDQKEITKIELVNNDDGTTIALGIGGENGFTYDAANNRYSFTLAYGQATNFELILTTSEKSIIFVGQSQSSNNTRVFSGSFNAPTLQNREFTNITIKAENGSVSSAFDIRITRAAADTNNKLEDIQINGVTVDGFLPSKGDYPVTIFERGTSSVFIEGFLPENSKATLQFYVNGSLVSGSRSINLEFTDNTPINVELRVTSESGAIFTYKVPVIAASNDSSIQNIQIYNASTNELVFNSFSQGTLEYNNITLPYSIETIKVVVTTTDAHATVMGIVSNGTYALNTTTPLNLTIFGKSEAGNESTNKYQFTIKRETPRSHKDLETLTVKYIDANNLEVIEELDVDASNNFTLRVDNHITPIQITATILGLQGERIVGSSTNTLTLTENFTAQQKTRTVNIIVVDEGGQQKTYTITITRANNDKVFETVKIGDRTYGIDEFDSNNKLTLDDVLFAVDRLTVLFNMIPNSNSTIVSPTSFIGNNLEGIWYFNSQTGLITATFQVKSEYGESSSDFTIEVYRETALSLKSLNGLKISAGSTVLLDETNTVADSYDIRVDRATSSVVIRTTLPIVDRSSVMSPYQPQVDEAPNKVYTYTLDLNNPNASAATIHQITVQAEDGTTKTYVITIWRRNANINLNEVTIKHGEDILHTGTFETAYEYLGNFEFNVSELTFIIKPADIYARITINNGQRLIPVDGVITTTIPLVVGTNREINLKVESDITQDEMSNEYLSKTYKFTYDKKTASNVAELDFLEAIVGEQDLLDGMTLDFANENEFGDFVVNRNFTSVTISATALNGGKITGIGSRVLLVGRNEFIITVTSQSGTHSKDYILVIYRNNDNNYITNIEVANHALGFDPSVTDYDLGTVLYDEDKLDISVTLGDQVHAKYYINNVLSQSQVSLNYGLNTIKIQAESDYGTKGTLYTITVTRETPYTDVDLNDLIVYFDDDLNNLITYNANTFTYTLELNPQDTPTTIRVMPELKNSFKQSISSTSNLDDDILINYQDGEINQTIKFIVYAEDNSQQEYTIIIKKGNVKSGDYSINDVIITNTISSNNYILFNPTQYQYSFDVAYSINQLNIDVNLNDLNAVITFVRRPVLLVIGDNLFEFFVTAENGEVGPTYKITVTRNQPSTDNELLELLIADPLNLGAYLLGLDSNNPQVVFDGRQTYTIILNEQYINEIITILFTKKVDAQLVTGDINKQLIIDQKTKRFEINVKPEDPNGITKAYFINVEIKYEQNSLTSLKIDDKNMNIALPLISHTTLKSSVSIQTTLDNIYGNVIIKDSLGNQVSGNTLNLEFGSNDYTVEVYSETGILVETHMLEVVREKHSDKDLNSVTLLGNDGTNYLTNFDETRLVYDIEVPINVSSVTLTANISPTAQLTGGGVYTISLDETKSITFFVTAENGDKSDTYTINVTRKQPSNDNELSEILISDPLNPGGYLLGLGGKNPLVEFDGRQTYTIILNEQYINEIITILFTKKVDAQLVTGDINKQLIIDQKTKRFEINVKPEDPNGITRAYFINVEIKYEQNSLISLKIDDKNMNIALPLISHTTLKSSVSIQTTLDNIYGNVIIKDSLDNQIIGNTLNLDFGTNGYNIEVYSETGVLVETHILEVVREKHSDKDLNSVTLLGNDGTNYLPNFDESQLVYDIEVPINVSSVTLTANISPTAQLTGGGVYTISLDETKSITFFVTAENGDKSDTYTINVTRKQPSNDNELLEILISDPLNPGGYLLGLGGKNPLVEFDGRQTYTIILNEQYINEIITILFTKKVDAQLVTGDINKQLIIDQKTKRFEINVKPEDPNGITRAYFINVEIKYEQNSLTSLKIDDKNMNIALPLISHTTLKSSVSIQTTLDNIYGNVIIKDSLGNQIIGNTLNLDFGTNGYNIEVYSETGVLVETHILEVVREKHSDKDLNSVMLLDNDGTNYLTNFDESQLVYDIEVPISVNTVTLTANISPTAQLTGGGTYTINLDQTKTITFFVTAENGDKSDTYTLNVTKRSLSTENEIGEIRFRDPLDNTRFILGLINKDPSYVFSPNVRDYTIELGLEYVGKQITVRYEKADSYQTITGLVNGQAIELIRGTNVFKLTVYPEDINNVDPLIYTVTINVKNKENGLESLKIDNQPIAFDSANPITYITENESAVVLVTPLNTDGKVTIKNLEGQEISSPLNLIVGDNIYTIEVTNEFGQIVESYDLIIERVLSSNVEVFDATLTDNELTNYLLFDKDVLHYELFVPFEMNELQLMINAHLKSLIYIDGIHIVDGKVSYILTSGEIKTISFYVVAENGDIGSTYTLEITKLQNTDDKLKELTILTNLDTLLSINDFDPENNYYAYQVNELHTHVTFSFLVNYGQTITGVTLDEAVLLNHGLNVFEIHVQPEDLTLDPFIITIEIEVINSNIDLSELLVDGQDIYETSKTEYRLDDVSSDTKMINIETILSDINGSVKINGVEADNRTINLVPGENTITIEITSEDLSTTKTYTILINQLLDDSDTLEVLSVLTNLNNYLLGDATNNPQIIFDPITNTYKFNVNEDVETIFVDFILGSIKQQISGPFNEYLNLEHGVNIFEFTVEPEDTNRPHRTYVIEINKINDEISVDQLLVNGKDIYEEGILDYTIDSVTNDIKIIKVIPSFDNYATYEIFDANNNLVTGHDVTLSFGINNIRVVATSESGLYTQTYTITIEQTYSDDNEIIDVRFFDASTNINRLNFDPDITTYNIEFPTTTNIARLRVETHNKALVFINDEQEINTRKDFNLISGNTITVKFYVVAENGDKGIEYTINVYKRKASDPVLSDNTNLLDVTIEIPINELKFNFDPTLYEYNIQLPYGHDEMYIKGHTESKGATVFGEGAYDLLPGVTKVIRLRVTAEDGTVAEKEYKFNITRALPNTDTTLKTLTIEDLNGNVLAFDQTTFNPENRTYNITLDDSMKLNTVNVLAEKNHETQTLYNTGIIQLHGEVEGYYNTIITVTVVAEDGSVGEYIIYVLHDLDFASLAEVKDISILGDDGISYFGLEFKNNIYVYEDILVPFNVDTTRLIVQTIGNVIYLDANNTEIDDNRLQSFGVGSQIVYRFRIESTNGSNKSEVYTIYVNRQQPDTNSLLETLEINGEMVRGFNPNIFEYTIVHPLQFEKYLDIYGAAQSDNSLVKGNDVYTLIEGQTRTITIEVKAESGDISSYKLHISYVNSNALLGELTVYEMIGEHDIQNTIPLLDDTLEYTIIIGKHTRYVNIKGFAKDQGGASIRGFGIREIGSEDTVVHITVTSGDGLEELTYVLTLRRDTSLSNLKEITLLQINNQEVITSDENNPFVYKYSLSNGTQSIKLSAVANNSSKISINGSEYSTNNMNEIILTDIQESQVIKISVQAEDGSIQHYMVIIEKPQQPSLLLTILLIISIILWVIAAMTYILKRIRKNNKKDKNQLIF